MKVIFELNATEMVTALKNGSLESFLGNEARDEKVVTGIKESKDRPVDKKTETKKEEKKTEPMKEEATKQEDKAEPTVSVEDIRTELTRLQDAGKKKLIKDSFEKFGATKLSEIKPEDYNALYELVKSL